MLRIKLWHVIIVAFIFIGFLSWRGGKMMILKREIQRKEDSLSIAIQYRELLEKQKAEIITPVKIAEKARKFGMDFYEEKKVALSSSR